VKVLVASHLYPSSLSRTAGSFVHNQARFLAPLAQVQVVSPTPWFLPLPGFGRWSAYASLPRREVREGVELERPSYLTFPRRVFFSQVWRFYLRALERGEGGRPLPDLIHAHCAYPDGLAAVEYGRRLGRPVVITVHGHDLKDLPRHPQWRALVAQALQEAQAVIAVSQELGQLARELGARGLRVIPNGVDCELFRPGARPPGEGSWRLLYVGRFDMAKGLGVLLEAMALLRQRRRDISLRLIGGNAATGTAAPFREQVDRLGLGECVEFAAEVPWQEVPRHMGESDVFVLPSFSEGLPLVLVEALACGLPLVATRCGGPEELVREGMGQLVEVGGVEGLARGIEGVLDNYATYDRQAIRRRAEEEYDYRRIAARLMGVYEEVLRNPL
jgi:glycosyltransferase involved in cell wall biosynthesis